MKDYIIRLEDGRHIATTANSKGEAISNVYDIESDLSLNAVVAVFPFGRGQVIDVQADDELGLVTVKVLHTSELVLQKGSQAESVAFDLPDNEDVIWWPERGGVSGLLQTQYVEGL